MTLSTYFQFAAALVFVLALIGCAAMAARRFGLGHAARTPGSRRRLGVVEVLPLDGRRKLVLLQCDGTEHLVILGQTGETVIDRGKSPPAHTSTFAGRLRQVTSPDARRADQQEVFKPVQACPADPSASEDVRQGKRS
ncbi:MAG: FliO/MopB family protein [Hyphomicrobiales bacterium]|nr:FliO/MopB family protein [Hyphomicrobiales bacterium]